MSATKVLEFHAVANIFPMMTAAEFASLKADVQENGLREPIWLYGGKIIDGRNRYLACLETKTKPTFRKYEGEESALIDFVISLNLHRRHLTTSQRACLAVEIMPELARRAKEELRKKISALNKGETHDAEAFNSREQASKIFGVSGKYISEARRLKDFSEELFNEVRAGKSTLQKAKSQIQSDSVLVILPKPESQESPQTLILSRREEQRVKEMVAELGVSEAKAKEFIVKRRRTASQTQKEKTPMKKIEFRVSEDDKNELQKKAKEQGKTVAELIRELLQLNFHR